MLGHNAILLGQAPKSAIRLHFTFVYVRTYVCALRLSLSPSLAALGNGFQTTRAHIFQVVCKFHIPTTTTTIGI